MDRFRYTRSAKVFAESQEGGVAALQAVAEQEIEGLKERGLEDLEQLFFHIFSWRGHQNMIMSPLDANTMLIDMADDDEDPVPVGGSPPPEGSDTKSESITPM